MSDRAALRDRHPPSRSRTPAIRSQPEPVPDDAPNVPCRIRTAAARELARCKTETLTCVSGAVVGVAPHVLHAAGPMAGTALVAGAGGQLLFGALGFLIAIPMLWRVHRHKGGWRAPAWTLAAFVVMFGLSSLVVGPALAGIGEQDPPAATQPGEVEPHGHTR